MAPMEKVLVPDMLITAAIWKTLSQLLHSDHLETSTHPKGIAGTGQSLSEPTWSRLITQTRLLGLGSPSRMWKDMAKKYSAGRCCTTEW
ncbi:hypothetical protein GRJ2_001651300 [Grus japonensis]|uniref:Uncharacterized protein n=1 Tax=Grus japonensis TaxID=30415 RepID=A0ABC9X2F3_GRUJA